VEQEGVDVGARIPYMPAMKTFRSWNPEQTWLLPPSVDQLVPKGDLAHFVRDTVLELDLSAILESYDEERGNPPFDPRMMTALLLYAYCRGIYSSRRMAQACARDTGFMAVTAMETPDFRTIAVFRKRHLEALQGLFVEVLHLCRKAGLVKLGHVALDGTKVKANASKHKAMSYDRMGDQERKLREEVRGWFERAQREDGDEDARYGAGRRGDEMPDWVSNKMRRIEKIREAKKALEEEGRARALADSRAKGAAEEEAAATAKDATPEPRAQRNFTDPESRIMKGADGFVQAYNCQAAVDSASQIIVAQGVTAQANDIHQLKPMLDEIKRGTGRQVQQLSADAGYCSEDNLAELRRRRIRGYVATGRDRHGNAAAKGACRTGSGILRRAMATRLRLGGWVSRYRLRKRTVEPVFGQIKQARGFRQFLLRGVAAVGLEWSLVATAHNLLKLHAAVHA